ncbi:cytochrome c oxidase subunit 4 [Marisediminicola antarctica]|uniref:cytochrome-c oxidase n=1 Tax=Marisediminicola antarctica TaxID=674079 RepID=A0A7L5AJD5_9MICO|nr:cytochrome c oxidase subunit 4 [Marisediminicola antarctica]QHO70172.1 cytochrome c oxidase subunit IV [Marisediminicola antarctica]
MVANTRLFWILTVFFTILAVVYTVWSLIDFNNTPEAIQRASAVEWAGTIALALTAILSALIAFYLGRTHSAQGGELPEDRLNANIDDGDAEQGFFSPWSWWPIMLAGGAALLFLGIAVGVWIAAIGAAVTLISLVGWMYEYYRGNFGR